MLFDVDLSLTAHVNELTARCYSSLRRIKSCRRALSRTASVTLINSLIVSRLSHQLPLASLSTLQLVETSSSLAPDFVLATGHSPSLVLWCGTVCPPTFDLHQHSAPSRIGSRLNCFYSRILYFEFHQLNSSSVCCTAPL